MDFNTLEAGDDPLGRYTLTHSFQMQTTELTQAQYYSLNIDYIPYCRTSCPQTFQSVASTVPDNLSWYDSAHVANILSLREGLSLAMFGVELD